MRSRLSFLFLATAAVGMFAVPATQATAQTPGFDVPLVSGLSPYSRGTTFRQGTVAIDIYDQLVEPVFDPVIGNLTTAHFECVQGVPLPMAGNGRPIYFPSRVLRFPKEEFHYSAVDWRGVPPGTYTVKVQVTWPDGFGVITGRWYPGGSMTETLDITITQ